MTTDIEYLKHWIDDVASLIKQSLYPDSKHHPNFSQEPELVSCLVDLIAELDEVQIDEDDAYYSACAFALELCVSQLQLAIDGHNKVARKILNQLMSRIALAMTRGKQSLGFWLPFLSAFYETRVELSDELQNAYFDLADDEETSMVHEKVFHLNSIRDWLEELSDFSACEIAENFFSQSYAMPADFFSDLVLDLHRIKEGHEVALLTLMHPKQEVRELVLETFESLMERITLSPKSLSRLQVIKNWYPPIYHEQFERWIKTQRKKGVTFAGEKKSPILRIKASAIDGTGAQGVFIHIRRAGKHRLCGLLFKQDIGIKDAWITPLIPAQDISRYYNESLDDTVMLRAVDSSYVLMIVNHFLALTIEHGAIPDLHLLEIQEELGFNFYPQKIEVDDLMKQLAVQITPFTPDIMRLSFQRSRLWSKHKRFTESWYLENPQIDKLVNQFCSFIEGVKVCQFDEAMEAVFEQDLELHRDRWLFHFLWVTLWLKAKARKNEKTWQDSFFIAYAIQTGLSLDSIPIMQEICYQSIVNSIETMQERRAHLYRE